VHYIATRVTIYILLYLQNISFDRIRISDIYSLEIKVTTSVRLSLQRRNDKQSKKREPSCWSLKVSQAQDATIQTWPTLEGIDYFSCACTHTHIRTYTQYTLDEKLILKRDRTKF